MKPERIVAAQYFTYFGVLGVYLPFFNLYCYHLGFSGTQIGLFSSVRSVTMALFPMLWGVVADRFRNRRAIYLCCNLASAAAWSLFLFTRDFSTMLAVAALYGVFYAPIISFLEAFAMEALGERKRRYGSLRAWGSVSFILVVLCLGRLLDTVSVEVVVPLILGGSLLHTLFALRLPPAAVPAGRFALGESGLFSAGTALFLAAGILMLFSHGTYYGFFSIHLENLGLDRTFIGLCWAVAVVAEIAVMVNSQRLFDRFPLRTVMAASFLAAALRWLVLGWTSQPWIILATQPLHAATYGTFHMASILYMDRLAAGASKTLGQAVNNALTYGMGLMVGFLVNGALYDTWTSFGLFRMSAGAALLGGVLFTVLSRPGGSGAR